MEDYSEKLRKSISDTIDKVYENLGFDKIVTKVKESPLGIYINGLLKDLRKNSRKQSEAFAKYLMENNNISSKNR